MDMTQKPRLVFINPPFEEYTGPKARKGRIRVYPSLGLCYLMAALKTDPGIQCHIDLIDCSADNMSIPELLIRLKEINPAIILVTTTTFTLRAAKIITDACREQLPSASIVLGGVHFNHSPGEFIHFNADYALRGECEFTLRDLVKCIFEKRLDDIRKIDGIVYKENGKIVCNKPATIENLDSIPFPDRSVLDPAKYIFPLFSRKFTTIIGSRGCPFKCVYCGLPNNLSYRKRSIDNIIAELKEILAMGYEYISFSDDLFTLDRKWVTELCSRILSENLRFEWGCATRADCVDPDLLARMKLAGCLDVRFGVESGVEILRKEIIHKTISNEQFTQSIRAAKRAGLITVGFFIFGHPTETIDNMKETAVFAKTLDLDYIGISIGIPIPNSELFSVALKEGKVDQHIWENVLFGRNEIPKYTPGTVSLDSMQALLSESMRAFYFRPSYILNQLKGIRTLKDLFLRLHNGFDLLISIHRSR